MERKNLTKWIIGIAVTCILIYLGVQNIDVVAGAISWTASLFTPLTLGFVFAIIINVPMRFFENKVFKKCKMRRILSYVVSLILILGILTGIILLVIPELIDAVKIIIESTIDFAEKYDANSTFGNLLSKINWESALSTMQDWLKTHGNNIVNTAYGTISSVLEGIVNVVIALVFSVYIIFSKENLKTQIGRLIRAWLPKSFGEWLIHAYHVASDNFRNFVSGQTLESLILGVLCMLGMLILRIPYAPMIGILVGVCALVPIVGAFIGAGVGAFIILTISPIKAVIFIAFLIILQQVEGNVIYPKVMGTRVNLPAMWILAAVTIGGGIAGPAGMLLGVPVASTTYTLLKEATIYREQTKTEKEES